QAAGLGEVELHKQPYGEGQRREERERSRCTQSGCTSLVHVVLPQSQSSSHSNQCRYGVIEDEGIHEEQQSHCHQRCSVISIKRVLNPHTM
ncbi:hypothetical protein GBAR_LOCUS9513, partial [Geodia barretti]